MRDAKPGTGNAKTAQQLMLRLGRPQVFPGTRAARQPLGGRQGIACRPIHGWAPARVARSDLGVRLLNRTPHGYVPTLAGQVVQEHAERLEAELNV